MPAPQATERTLRALLRFAIDPRGVRDVIHGSGEIDKALDELDNTIANAESDLDALESAFLSVGGVMESVGTRQAINTKKALGAIWESYKRGEIGLQEVKKALDELEPSFRAASALQTLRAELDLLETEAMEAGREITELSNVVQQYESVGMEFRDLASRITDPLRTFAEQYVRMAGEADEKSKLWLETTEELEKAQSRLGGVAIDSILPLMELTTDVLTKAAEFAEKYPELIQLAFGIGTVVIMATALQSAVSRGIRLIADAKLILIETKRFIAAQMNRDAADKMLVAATMNQRAAKQQLAGGAGGGVRGALGAIGGLGGLGSALAVGGAVAAWVAVGLKVKAVGDDAKKMTEQMGSEWDKFFKEQTGSAESATDLARSYNDAQRRVNEAYDEGGLVASIFFDREKLVNANRAKLSTELIKIARNYEDYETAVESLNEELGRDEQQIVKLDRATYRYRRKLAELHDEYARGEASLRDIASLQLQSNNLFQQVAGLANLAISELGTTVATSKLVDVWVELQEEIEAANSRFQEESEAAWQEYLDEREKMDAETAAELERIQNEYAQASLKIELDAATEREQILAQAGLDMVKREEEIGQEREQTMIDFHEEMKQAEVDHYKERAEAAADFGLEMQRAEQDHQLSMRRMREDSELRQVDAIRSRDAIALIEEKRSYERERQRAETDFQIEMGRRNQDFARQMAQMEASFREQQAARQRSYEEQLAALRERQAEEKRMVDAATEEQLAALEERRVLEQRSLYDGNKDQEDQLKEHNETQSKEAQRAYRDRRREAKRAQNRELEDAYNTWRDRRQAQGVFLSGELEQIRTHYRQRLTELRNWMHSANAIVQQSTLSSTKPGRAAGGYAGMGTYQLGERGYEYVLDHATTRMAEHLAGGRLTQAGVQGLMAGGGGDIYFSQQNVIQEAGDPAKTADLIERRTLEIIRRILKKAK